MGIRVCDITQKSAHPQTQPDGEDQPRDQDQNKKEHLAHFAAYRQRVKFVTL